MIETHQQQFPYQQAVIHVMKQVNQTPVVWVPRYFIKGTVVDHLAIICFIQIVDRRMAMQVTIIQIPITFTMQRFDVIRIMSRSQSGSSLVEGGEGLYLPNFRTNLVIVLYTLSLLLSKFINKTAYHLGRYEPSSFSTKEFHELVFVKNIQVQYNRYYLTPITCQQVNQHYCCVT